MGSRPRGFPADPRELSGVRESFRVAYRRFSAAKTTEECLAAARDLPSIARRIGSLAGRLSRLVACAMLRRFGIGVDINPEAESAKEKRFKLVLEKDPSLIVEVVCEERNEPQNEKSSTV